MSKPGNLKSVTLCLIAYCYKMENLADLKKNPSIQFRSSDTLASNQFMY